MPNKLNPQELDSISPQLDKDIQGLASDTELTADQLDGVTGGMAHPLPQPTPLPIPPIWDMGRR